MVHSGGCPDCAYHRDLLPPDSEGRAMKTTRGYIYVLLAALMWASSGTAGKALFEGGMTPFELVQIRVTLSSLLLGVVLAISPKEYLKIRWKDVGYFLVLGVGMALVQGTYFFTISKIQVAAAILIQYLSPFFVAFYSILFWKERFTGFKALALLLSFGGCYLVVGGYDLELLKMNRLGIMVGVLSAILFAGYSLLGERGMHRYRPWTVLFYALLFAALSWHVFFTPFHYLKAGFSAAQWGWLLYISVIGTILPFGLYFMGVNYIRSTRASITATLEPISAGLMAFLFIGETLSPLQILGGILVIGAVVLLQLRQEQDKLAPILIRGKKA
ncbi:MAG: EamA family transporter [Deltaproteobacteria bacterium HGW-Deltaproteobacteria-15]|nr:MAG: EamA family transporter [Deltaproteobacteria bacterium HGW-Deltaproteobacteria-15]